MNNTPYKHVKQIIGKRLKGEEKLSVLAYLDHQHAELSKYEKELRKINNSRGF